MIPGSANPLLLKSAAAAGPVQIERSLRFNSSDSAYLSRTPASAGNRKTWTWAGWVKRSALGSNQALMTVEGNSDSTTAQFWFSSDDKFRFGIETADIFVTNAVFRDCSAWYHIVFAFDATNATSADRMILYINGVRQTTSTYTAPSNTDYGFNRASAIHAIGRRQNVSDWYLNGYLADVHFIDGQALTPSSFTEVSATTGQLIPKAYTGSYTGNSFWLKFSDNSAATATTLGKDSFLLGNNWTPNNLSVTAGAGNDSLVDTPTSYGTDTGAGGEVRGNYVTLNPLDKNASATLTNGNLDFYNSAASHYLVRSTLGITSGKWYWEVTVPSDASSAANFCAGICRSTHSLSLYVGGESSGWGLLGNGNTQNGPGASYTTALALGDVIGVAFDADSGKIWWSKNGTYPNSGNPATGANAPYSNVTVGSGPYFPAVSAYQSAAIFTSGQRAFAYTAPSGFKALVDTNLGAPVVAKPNTVFDVKLYDGNRGTQTISGLGFSPDLVWIKDRTQAFNHALHDIVRGAGVQLITNDTTGEFNTNQVLTAFTSSGFTVNWIAGVGRSTNESPDAYVAWAWDAGTSTVSNTSGSITSQVRANASAGFSIVTYTGTLTSSPGTAPTVGHGLGVKPALIISKSRNPNGDDGGGWYVNHNYNYDNYLRLNTTGSQFGISAQGGGTTANPTASVFSTYFIVGSNCNNNNYVAYCFAPVAGYLSIGSYTGNGSTDGPFVYTGFRPRWILTKRYDGGANGWGMFDALRPGYNLTDSFLQAQSSGSESTGASAYSIDILSNGFKVRGTDAFVNQSGGSYIYCAFAESPLQYARAR